MKKEPPTDDLNLIAKYRDRFSTWGLIIASLSFVAAMWTRAPALNVALPLVGGTQIGLNVGYILMAGPLFICIAMAWAMGPLLAMRRQQEALLSEVEKGHTYLLEHHRQELCGPYGANEGENIFARSARQFSKACRYLLFFVCPVASALVIGKVYFVDLRTYDRAHVVDHFLNNSSAAGELNSWHIEPKR